jgi:hypothetical protein
MTTRAAPNLVGETCDRSVTSVGQSHGSSAPLYPWRVYPVKPKLCFGMWVFPTFGWAQHVVVSDRRLVLPDLLMMDEAVHRNRDERADYRESLPITDRVAGHSEPLAQFRLIQVENLAPQLSELSTRHEV